MALLPRFAFQASQPPLTALASIVIMAETVRFELTRGFHLRWFSRPEPSTTRPRFRILVGPVGLEPTVKDNVGRPAQTRTVTLIAYEASVLTNYTTGPLRLSFRLCFASLIFRFVSSECFRPLRESEIVCFVKSL